MAAIKQSGFGRKDRLFVAACVALAETGEFVAHPASKRPRLRLSPILVVNQFDFERLNDLVSGASRPQASFSFACKDGRAGGPPRLFRRKRSLQFFPVLSGLSKNNLCRGTA
jgi:hypothetical protein